MNLENAPDTVKNMPADKINNLDVRPTLKAGGEPFGEIMAAVKTTANDGALRLRATFEPKPLYKVLGGQGFKNWVEFGQGDDWMIWFYKE